MPTASDANRSASTTPRRGIRAMLIAPVVLVVLLMAYGREATLGAIDFYQRRVAPIAAAAGVRCRMTPTCSRYAETVIARDGLFRGGLNAAARIARCGPWTPAGTNDPP